jgi:hypothetical protein
MKKIPGTWMLMMVLSWSGQRLWAQTGNMDATAHHAWSEQAGYVDFRPEFGGAAVHDDHLSGHLWAENLGWIQLGSAGGGPYANTSAATYGVNRLAGGGLSGYAWSENAGWIRFDHAFGEVTVDPDSGQVEGYVWGENIGWIHLGHGATLYQVQAVFPTAAVSGTASICEHTTTEVSVALTGFAPWRLEWSDGEIQEGVTVSPATRTLVVDTSETLSVEAVSDAYASGHSSGSARITVRPFAAGTIPAFSLAQGWDPEVLEAVYECGVDPVTVQWSIQSGPDAGYVFPLDENPVTLEAPHPVPLESTDYQVDVYDSSAEAVRSHRVRLLVAEDSWYFDVNDDQCNNLHDLWELCPEWLEVYPQYADPDGDGVFRVLDYLYLNLSDPLDCDGGKHSR